MVGMANPSFLVSQLTVTMGFCSTRVCRMFSSSFRDLPERSSSSRL